MIMIGNEGELTLPEIIERTIVAVQERANIMARPTLARECDLSYAVCFLSRALCGGDDDDLIDAGVELAEAINEANCCSRL